MPGLLAVPFPNESVATSASLTDMTVNPLTADDTTMNAPLGAQLERGYTLPASWYSDPEIWALERERIFARTWQYAGPVEWLPGHGSYFTSRAGHIPVVVVRDGDEIRAFVNVCRHRGHLVAAGRGRRNTLQCPYHAWTYGLDGCLRSAPRAREEQATFAFDELGLYPVGVEAHGPFVFVNPDRDAPPLAETLGDVPARLERSGVDLSSLRLRRTVDWECRANWKNAVENYLECYHCAVAHPGFSAAIDVAPSRYLLEAAGATMSQYGPARHSAGTRVLPAGEIEEAQSHLIFPNTSIDIAPGPPNLMIYAWGPTGPGTMAASSHYFFPDGVAEEDVQQIVDFNEQVSEEDMRLIDAVQQGLDSGAVPFGRLMPESERLIAHFQRLVFDHVSGESAP